MIYKYPLLPSKHPQWPTTNHSHSLLPTKIAQTPTNDPQQPLTPRKIWKNNHHDQQRVRKILQNLTMTCYLQVISIATYNHPKNPAATQNLPFKTTWFYTKFIQNGLLAPQKNWENLTISILNHPQTIHENPTSTQKKPYNNTQPSTTSHKPFTMTHYHS